MTAVLDQPPATVIVDSIADGQVIVMSFAYGATQRDVYPTRSELLFRLLTEFRAAGIDLVTAPQQMQLIGAVPSPDRSSVVSGPEG